MNDVTSRAVEAYHDLLTDEALAGASSAELEAGQHRHGLFFGDAPLSVSLRPSLVSAERWGRAVAAANAIREALFTLETALIDDEGLRRELDLSPEEEVLVTAPPAGRSSSSSSRLDSFFADEVRYVEYNAESPAGIAYGDVLGEVVDRLPVMERFRRDWVARPMRLRHSQLRSMLRAYEEWGVGDKPSVAIVDWPGLPTLTEFEMFREYFQANGISCCICEPAALEYDGYRLRACDGSAVSIVYRRVLTSELLTSGGLDQPLCRAYLDGTVVVVNSFRSKLLHKKMSLALLSDDRYEDLYTPAQRAAIARHVPWTRKMVEGPANKDDREIGDLVDYVAAHRDQLVLKPNDEYGGRGVVLGWTVGESEWAASIRVALTESYVVQEAVPVPREMYPLAVGGRVEFAEMAVDMDPYLFDGQVGGVMTRLSSSALLNVTAGSGSLVPTFVVEERKE